MGNEGEETVFDRMLKALPEDFSKFSEVDRNAISEAAKLRNHEIPINEVKFFHDKSHYRHYI